jgi:hypothetical protein
VAAFAQYMVSPCGRNLLSSKVDNSRFSICPDIIKLLGTMTDTEDTPSFME